MILVKKLATPFLISFLLLNFSSISYVCAQILSATSTQTIKIQVIRPDLPQCSNGLDDDLDGKIDFPEDPGCADEDDNDEMTPTPSPSPPPPSGGGAYIPPATSVVFSGRAYPKSAVTLLKDAQVAATTIAGADANFQISISGLTAGNYIFSIYSEDKEGRRSSLLTFSVSVTAGAMTSVSGIFIAPTIAVDKIEVKRGDNIAIFGQSVPQADIIISVSSDEEFFGKTISDKDGIYLYNFDTSLLDYGAHNTKSKASIGNQLVSGWSYPVGFKVGTKTVLAKPLKCPPKADLNKDCRVNLVDFSIAAYWYKRPLSEAFKKIEAERLNRDGKINLVDFSIMAFYWTG